MKEKTSIPPTRKTSLDRKPPKPTLGGKKSNSKIQNSERMKEAPTSYYDKAKKAGLLD